MRSARTFWALAVLVSSLLFWKWWSFVQGGEAPYFVEDVAFVIPVAAMIAVSASAWKHKVVALVVLALVFVLGDRVAYILGAREIAETGRTDLDSAARLGGAVYHAFRIGVPVAALLLFTRGRASSLWTSEARANRPQRKSPSRTTHGRENSRARKRK